jgi:hypothetical protein
LIPVNSSSKSGLSLTEQLTKTHASFIEYWSGFFEEVDKTGSAPCYFFSKLLVTAHASIRWVEDYYLDIFV